MFSCKFRGLYLHLIFLFSPKLLYNENMTCCNECNNPCKKNCSSPCGCAEPVFSVEAMPDDPTILRFNVNGKSVWYDFSPVVKNAETCTTLNVDAVARTLSYLGECGENTIAARELGSILHLADIGDVDADSIRDNGILNYQKNTDCPEGCEGTSSGWRTDNPVDIAESSLDYILGSDNNGKLSSLMPPTDTNKFNYVAWAAGDKIKYVTPTIVASIPDDGTYQYPAYMDPATGEIVVYRKEIQ